MSTTPETPIIDRLAKFLSDHPREAAIVSYRPPREPDPQVAEEGEEPAAPTPGMFMFASHFGEEAPEPTLDARQQAIAEWANGALKPLEEGVGFESIDVSHASVTRLLDALRDVDANVMAGGAIYGLDESLEVSIGQGLKDARA